MCGGTLHESRIEAVALGLSPRVRGNPVYRTVYPRVCGGTDRSSGYTSTGIRSIPACAGEPDALNSVCLRTVYPRVCGGTDPARQFIDDPTGLSPRVRGNPGLHLIPASFAGSIPACAGEPHLTHTDLTSRSIPACAGEPRSKLQRMSSKRSIPACAGEPIFARKGRATCDQGLSPRVRGNQQRGKRNDLANGSIPACAGEPIVRVWQRQ